MNYWHLVTTWMTLKYVILSERNQTQRYILCNVLYMKLKTKVHWSFVFLLEVQKNGRTKLYWWGIKLFKISLCLRYIMIIFIVWNWYMYTIQLNSFFRLLPFPSSPSLHLFIPFPLVKDLSPWWKMNFLQGQKCSVPWFEWCLHKCTRQQKFIILYT